MIFGFGPFELDPAKGELRDQGRVRPVEPQVFGVLALLVSRGDALVTREDLIDAVWQGRAVTDATLASRVRAVRRALGDDGVSQRYVRTVHGRGWRFVAPVRTSGARPSIAILPFRCLGAPQRWALLGQALPLELTSELARLRWLEVTASASALRLSATARPREVARQLGVRYSLSGCAEVSGSRLSIAVELADTRDEGLVWAETVRGDLAEVHLLRAALRENLLSALELRIQLHEAGRARSCTAEELDAWGAFHLGLQHAWCFTREHAAQAAALFRRAIALDEGMARAHAGLSLVHFQTAFLHLAADPGAEIEAARRWAGSALERDPLDPFVNFTRGRCDWLSGDLDAALRWHQRATALCPNYAQGIYALAWTEALSGRCLDGRRHVDRAMDLSPIDPLRYAMLGTRAFTHLGRGEDEEAAHWAERAAGSAGAHVLIVMLAAAMHRLAGDAGAAGRRAREARARDAALGCDDFLRSFPLQPPAVRARVTEALVDLGFRAPLAAAAPPAVSPGR